jgi:hypothetical protein
VISCSIVSRKRPTAMPASSPVRMSWRALPTLTGDVRRDSFGFAGQMVPVDAPVVATAYGTTPGPLAWSPPI